MVHAVILAGGSGKRLWPLSRQRLPKQIVPFGDTTLLHMTLERVRKLSGVSSISVVTTHEQAESIAQRISPDIQLIIEPRGNNTACALLYSCLSLLELDSAAHIMFIPADHVISEQQQYEQALLSLIAYTHHHDVLGLIGVVPSYAASQYGYIERAHAPLPGQEDLFAVNSFHEKPSSDVAQLYVTDKRMLWNAGIFCASAQKFIELFMYHAPDLYAQVRAGSFDDITPLSFDTAILEYAHGCVVLQALFSWTDVGTLQHFIEQAGQSQKTVLHDAHNIQTYSVNNKLIVVYGVNDICVVEADDVIIVTSQQHTASIDRVVDLLQKKGYEPYL